MTCASKIRISRCPYCQATGLTMAVVVAIAGMILPCNRARSAFLGDTERARLAHLGTERARSGCLGTERARLGYHPIAIAGMILPCKRARSAFLGATLCPCCQARGLRASHHDRTGGACQCDALDRTAMSIISCLLLMLREGSYSDEHALVPRS